MIKKEKVILPKRAKDLTGQRFGRLVALEPIGKDRWGHFFWQCQCDCGSLCTVISSNLQSGHAQSCGCLCRERVSTARKIHGMSNSPTYRTWHCMLQRCENSENKNYKFYGGRGIKVCERWHDFKNFYEDMGDRPAGKTLDRSDDNGNYEFGNCKWSTMKEQCNNRRDRIDQKWFLGFNTLTGAFEENNNQSEFAREHNLLTSSIGQCLHGSRKRTKGWEFDYLPLC